MIPPAECSKRSNKTSGSVASVANIARARRVASKRSKGTKGKHINQLVRPLMGSEAPCCGGGLSGNCLLITHFIL